MLVDTEKLKELAERLVATKKEFNYLDVGYSYSTYGWVNENMNKYKFRIVTNFNKDTKLFKTMKELEQFVDEVTHENKINSILFRKFEL